MGVPRLYSIPAAVARGDSNVDNGNGQYAAVERDEDGEEGVSPNQPSSTSHQAGEGARAPHTYMYMHMTLALALDDNMTMNYDMKDAGFMIHDSSVFL